MNRRDPAMSTPELMWKSRRIRAFRRHEKKKSKERNDGVPHWDPSRGKNRPDISSCIGLFERRERKE
jgi:hypothetical protein